jgi:hypothetical protein
MFIQTQPTPNPASLMFIPGQKVMESGSKSFTSAREAMASPLAKKLFAIDGVTQVGWQCGCLRFVKSVFGREAGGGSVTQPQLIT